MGRGYSRQPLTGFMWVGLLAVLPYVLHVGEFPNCTIDKNGV